MISLGVVDYANGIISYTYVSQIYRYTAENTNAEYICIRIEYKMSLIRFYISDFSAIMSKLLAALVGLSVAYAVQGIKPQ